MEFVIALLLAAATAWLIASIGTTAIDRHVSAIAQLVGGWRPEPWPRGVQEEDRDQPWSWLGPPRAESSAALIEERAASVPTTRLDARTTVR